jgi:hypothetical protein
VGNDAFFAIDNFPPVQGLDQLIIKCINKADPKLPPLRKTCQTGKLETLPWTDLLDGRTNNLHSAVVKESLATVSQLVKEKGYAIEATNSDRYLRTPLEQSVEI